MIMLSAKAGGQCTPQTADDRLPSEGQSHLDALRNEIDELQELLLVSSYAFFRCHASMLSMRTWSQELRAKVLLLEAGREEIQLQATVNAL